METEAIIPGFSPPQGEVGETGITITPGIGEWWNDWVMEWCLDGTSSRSIIPAYLSPFRYLI